MASLDTDVGNLARDLGVGDVVVHAGHQEARANERHGSRAFFADGEIALHPRELLGARVDVRALLAHEMAHAAQATLQRPPGAGDGRAVEAEAAAIERAFTSGRPLPEPRIALPAGHFAANLPGHGRLGDVLTDDQLMGLLGGGAQSEQLTVATLIVTSHGGLRLVEADFPRTFDAVRTILIDRYGREVYQLLYTNDARMMAIIESASNLAMRLQAIAEAEYGGADQSVAYAELVGRAGALSSIGYDHLAGLVAVFGEFVILNDISPLAQLARPLEGLVQTERENAEDEQRSARAAAGRTRVAERLLHTRMATVEGIFFDTPLIADRLVVATGFTTEFDAVARARLDPQAAAVCLVGGLWYVYRLDHDVTVSDIFPADWFVGHSTDLIPASQIVKYVVTSDGSVVVSDGTRFLGREHLEDAPLQEANLRLVDREADLTSAQVARLFRQLLTDAVFERLGRSRADMERQLARFGGAHPSARPIEDLQANTAELRAVMVSVGQLLARGEALSDADVDILGEDLARMGEITQTDPAAVMLVVDQRDEEDRGTAPRSADIVDELHGLSIPEARSRVTEELRERIDNVERIRRHLTENPDAVLDLQPLHAEFLARFSTAHRFQLTMQLAGNRLADIAAAIGMTVLDVGLVVLGLLTAGSTSLIAIGLGTVASATSEALSARGVVQQFENARLLEAMSADDMTGEAALVSPQDAADAQFWAWVGAGIAVAGHVAAFAWRARSLARLRRLLAHPELARLLRGNHELFEQVAREMGMEPRVLQRTLENLSDAGRSALIRRMEDAVTRIRLRDPFNPETRMVLDAPGFLGRETPQGRRLGQVMSGAVDDATAGVRGGRIRSLRDLLDFLAPYRRRVAEELGEEGAADMGVWRQSEPGVMTRTPISGERYGRYAARASFGLVTEEIRGRQVPLTMTAFGQWTHTDPEQFARILPHMEGLYQRALRARGTREVIERVAELHWWLAHLMPFRRGSAAVSDAVTKTIFQYHGIDVSRWGTGVVPDLEAFLTSRTAFIRRYQHLFAAAPRSSPR